jgi:YjbE family integral membrane protein
VDFGILPSFIGATIEIAAVNLLLCGDNAVLIALACRPLTPELRQRVLLFGLVGAIALRFGLAGLVSAALPSLPGLRLAAAIFLVWVAVRLLSGLNETRADATDGDQIAAGAQRETLFWQSVLLVVAADAVMSLDNIVAVVSVAQGSAALLILGLLFSVPALMYGSFLLAKIFDEWPILMLTGAVLIGWVAGQMAQSDALISEWMANNAPALASMLPALTACYVYVVGHWAMVSRSRER